MQQASASRPIMEKIMEKNPMSVRGFIKWRSFAAAALLAIATILLPHHVALGTGTAFEPGAVFRDCAQCPELVVVPPRHLQNG